MKKYKAILFDMDGTLVPMDMKEFTSGYFKFLGKRLAPFGIPQDELVAAIWAGTGAMAKNDGSRTNAEVFWSHFEKLTGVSEESIRPECDDFYGREFVEAKIFTQDNPLAIEAVKIAHEKAPKVILATNPLFPMAGQITRMGWVGLKPEDFDHVTSYEADSYCKPNPMFFTELCKKMVINPSECLMIGNDEYEDMYCCTEAGIDGYLVTDTMIPSSEHPWNGPRGTFKDLIEMLKNL